MKKKLKLKFKFSKLDSNFQALKNKNHKLPFDVNEAPLEKENTINSLSSQPLGYTPMATLKEIDAQLAALKAQREEVRKSELKTAIDKVRSLVVEYGLTESDVFPPARGARSTTTAGTKVAPKYRDPETGATWTGRGKAPKWIDGQEREKFAI